MLYGEYGTAPWGVNVRLAQSVRYLAGWSGNGRRVSEETEREQRTAPGCRPGRGPTGWSSPLAERPRQRRATETARDRQGLGSWGEGSTATAKRSCNTPDPTSELAAHNRIRTTTRP